ncbi:MAG: hypothetical protein ACRED6_09655 [Stellaceae bacterium]
MNWKHGLFRAWSAISIVWVIVLAVVVLTHPNLRGDYFSLLGFLTASVVPPGLLLILGIALRWIVMGFRD